MTGPAIRTATGQFPKGRSGNPSGRPKTDLAIRAAARCHTELAIATLVEVCKNKRAPPAARVTAASALLDRGWGKPSTEIDIYVTLLRQLEGKSDDELVRLARLG